jgi:hypothetical protein
VWPDTAVTDHALTRIIAQIRRALGDEAREARYLETVPTRGYRWNPSGGKSSHPRARRWRTRFLLSRRRRRLSSFLAASAAMIRCRARRGRLGTGRALRAFQVRFRAGRENIGGRASRRMAGFRSRRTAASTSIRRCRRRATRLPSSRFAPGRSRSFQCARSTARRRRRR